MSGSTGFEHKGSESDLNLPTLRPRRWLLRPRFGVRHLLLVPLALCALQVATTRWVREPFGLDVCLDCGAARRFHEHMLFRRWPLFHTSTVVQTECSRFVSAALGEQCSTHRWTLAFRVDPIGYDLGGDIASVRKLGRGAEASELIEKWNGACSAKLWPVARSNPDDLRRLISIVLDDSHPSLVPQGNGMVILEAQMVFSECLRRFRHRGADESGPRTFQELLDLGSEPGMQCEIPARSITAAKWAIMRAALDLGR
ncbi:MAG: hypothetical protein HYZ53_14000 [Planctomycetes bacterium]|nr:hypothetical protein [Planctomycetota bacterium]